MSAETVERMKSNVPAAFARSLESRVAMKWSAPNSRGSSRLLDDEEEAVTSQP